MAITTRETTATGVTNKGSPLTNAEVDTNFVELQQNKLELDDLSVGADADPSGDGSVSYDNTTGVFTYTPPADISGAVTFAAKAGEALTKGDAVYVSGVSGNKPVVSKADADDSSKMAAFGLAEADASLNAAVNVVTFGTLYNLDTSGFTAGDTVYVDTTAGGLTATKPSGESSLVQNIGKVMRSHASAGSIKVGGAGRTNDVPNLNDGNVFIGNASNQSEARALTTSDIASGTFANARIAEGNVTQHQAALSITESQISDLQTYLTSSTVRAAVEAATDSNVFTDADHTKLNGIETNATADQTDAEIRAAVEAATDSNVFTDADHSKLDGIEASADVTDTANVTAAGALMDSEVTNLAQVKAFDSSDYATAAQGSTADSALQNVVEDTTPQLGGNLDFNGNTATSFASTGIDDNATSTAITIDSSQNVGINEQSPSSKLEVGMTSGDVITLKDTNLTASASNIGNVRIAWDDSAGTRVAYVGTVNSDDFWINNQYSQVVLSYAGVAKAFTKSSGWGVTGDIDASGGVTAGASATGGITAYAINYSGDHLLNVLGSLKSSGNTVLTYGAKPSTSTNNGYVSAAGNFAFEKTALELTGGGLSVKFSPSGTDAVGSALTMSTMLDVSGSTAVGCTVSIKAGSSGNEGGQLNLDTVSSGTYSIDAYSDDMRFLNGTSAGNYLFYKNSNTGISTQINGAGGLTTYGLAQITPTSGSVTIGPQNTSFCHFSTDRAKHYFNKPVHMDGGAVDYDTGDHFLLPNANNSESPNLSTARNGGAINYIYNRGSNVTLTRGDFAHHIIQQWSGTATFTITSSTFLRGDIIEFINVRGTVTITVVGTRIYLPTGSYDTTLTLSDKGKFRLIKYSTSAGYWMLG